MSPQPGERPAGPACGFLFAATGPDYLRLATKAARSLKACHPDHPVDLFTDAALAEAGPFDQVHIVPETGPRPRFHALLNSRFDRSILLDADMMIVAPIDDIFQVLERFDLAFAQDQWRNSDAARRSWRADIPAAFPQVNGGLIALRHSRQTAAFIRDWHAAYRADGSGYDQPALREVLWDSPDLRVAILPEEYNLWDIRRIDRMHGEHAAPRIIHYHLLRSRPVLASEGDELRQVLGRARLAHLERLIENDATLHRRPGGDRTSGHFGLAHQLRTVALGARDLPRKLTFKLRALQRRLQGPR